jgi:hypothetical protein
MPYRKANFSLVTVYTLPSSLDEILQTKDIVGDHEGKDSTAIGVRAADEHRNEVKTKWGRRKDMDFVELVRFLPFNLNNKKKSPLPHGRKRKR